MSLKTGTFAVGKPGNACQVAGNKKSGDLSQATTFID